MCVLLLIKKKTGQRQWKLWARTHKYFQVQKGFNINEVTTRLYQPYKTKDKIKVYDITLCYCFFC